MSRARLMRAWGQEGEVVVKTRRNYPSRIKRRNSNVIRCRLNECNHLLPDEIKRYRAERIYDPTPWRLPWTGTE